MSTRTKIPWEPVKMENILQVQIAEYVADNEVNHIYRHVSSVTTTLGNELIPSGQRVRVIFELMEGE